MPELPPTFGLLMFLAHRGENLAALIVVILPDSCLQHWQDASGARGEIRPNRHAASRIP
jgi:hypothetical protein